MHKIEVLFVCSGNNDSGRSPNVDVQAAGLMDVGVEVHFFEISDKGIKGYVKNIFKLRNYLRKNTFDVIHAHYGLSGIVASLAGAKPLLVTIMGSEMYMNKAFRKLMMFFMRYVWKKTIVQSEQMKMLVGGKRVVVLPNGVDVSRFSSVSRKEAEKITGYDKGKHVIWVSDPSRVEKDITLAEDAINCLEDKSVKLEIIYGQPYDKIPFYFRAADVLLLTSKWEGSPNVVKEALAAGLPVVSVDVGDVSDLLSGVAGCYVAKSNTEDIAAALVKALAFGKETNGIEKVKHLEMKTISNRIKDVYKTIIAK